MPRKEPIQMPHNPQELHRLLHLQGEIKEIQSAFDSYQRACFKERPAEFFALELNGEAGELANNEKKLWKGETVARELVEDEAADVFIALMNYCNAREIPLGRAVAAKLVTIEKRRQDANPAPDIPTEPEAT